MKTFSTILLAMFIVSCSLAGAAEPLRFYVGTYTSQDGSRGIYTGQFDADSGRLTEATLAAEYNSPAFLAVHPSKPVLFAINEAHNGNLMVYQYNKESGQLTLLDEKPVPGHAPCHLAFLPSENGASGVVVIANYTSGSVVSFPISEEGKIGNVVSNMTHTGSGPNTSRQRAPHAHGVYFDGDTMVAVPDLGIDQVVYYKMDAATAELSPLVEANLRLAPGAGPRHLALSKESRFVYVVNELDSTVSVFDKQSAEPAKPVQTVSTLTEGKDAAALRNTTAEIELHSSGKFLYASNRGDDSIAVFAVNSEGRLSLLQNAPTGGKTPRFFCLDPTGRFLLACNQDTGTICVLAVDQETGRLTMTEHSINVSRPVCLVFVR